MDIDAIWFELQHFKNKRDWYNLNLPRERLVSLLSNPDWYRLYISRGELDFRRFDQVRCWQEIAVVLLRKYIDHYYKYRKQE